nr:GNAT family N-acetyltransferase [Nitrospirota bacterium]
MSATPRLRCEVVTDFSALERLAGEWDRLWNTDSRGDVFKTFAWARASWRAYGAGLSLYAPVVYQGENVVGILPLVMEGRTLRFLGAPHSDYNDFLCGDGASSLVLETALWALLKDPVPWDRCIFENVSEHSIMVQRLGQLTGSLCARLHLSFSSICPAVVFTDGNEGALAAILKKKSLLRHEKSLGRLGEVSFRHLEGREEIKSHLPGLFRQHIARWALAGGESIFLDEGSRSFYGALADELDPRSDLRFSVLELDKRPIAYHFGFEVNGAFLWYKPTFDVDLWEHSPGEVLIRKLFEYAASRKLREFDFTMGNETFKNRFANRIRRNYRLHLYRPGPYAAARRVCHRAKDRLKESPSVRRAFGVWGPRLRSLWKQAADTLRRHGPLGTSKMLLGSAFREAVFAYDVVLVYSFANGASRFITEDLRLESGTLQELACFSVEDPEWLTPTMLGYAREWLKRGDKLYITRWRGAGVQVLWTRVQSSIAAFNEIGRGCRIELGRPAVVIHDTWMPPAARGGGVYPNVLRAIVQSAQQEGKQCWTHCLSDDSDARRGIEQTGFKLKHRMCRIRISRWLQYAWVRECPVRCN